MKSFVIPTDFGGFKVFLREKVCTSKNEAFAIYDEHRMGIYTIIDISDKFFNEEVYPNKFITFEDIKNYWTEYNQEERMIADFPAGGFIVGASIGKKVNFSQGISTAVGAEAEEYEVREKIVALVSSLDFPSPFSVEINPSQSDMIRPVPTVIISGKEVWRDNGSSTTTSGFIPVVFNGVGNIGYFPCYITNQSHLYFVADNNSGTFVLPFASIRENKSGLGNTVLLNSIQYAPILQGNFKSIYSFLTEKLLWTKVLIPLATMSLSAIKEQVNNQELSVSMQVKLFNLQTQTGLLKEIETLAKSKQEYISNIDISIRQITDLKVEINKIDKRLVEKQKEAEKAINSKNLEQEFERIKALPYITELKFNSVGIEFHTNPIPIDDGPELGGYRIIFNPATKEFLVYNDVNPITRPEGLAHPHVPQGGYPCFGNYTDIFFRFETGQYYIGLELLHKFLSTYNPEDSWGRRLYYWPHMRDFFYKDMKERELTDSLSSAQDPDYYAATGEHLPCVRICAECGGIAGECECDVCPTCHRRIDDCDCWICPECGENVDSGNCDCDRCEACSELITECGCERCEFCHELIDYDNYYTNHCICVRCPDDYTHIVDEEDDPECQQCLAFGCRYNQNIEHEDHPDNIPHQEEQIPGLDEMINILTANDLPINPNGEGIPADFAVDDTEVADEP